MTSLRLPVLVALVLVAPSCGSGGGGDAGAPIDATLDAPVALDAPVTPDAPVAPDAPVVLDAPTSSDGGGCLPGLGADCTAALCPMGLECMVGRCTPQGRVLCGGFAGAPCTDPAQPVCLYFSSTDFGTCVTAEERVCLCAAAPTYFVGCP